MSTQITHLVKVAQRAVLAVLMFFSRGQVGQGPSVADILV
jgi:hypothetical protein